MFDKVKTHTVLSTCFLPSGVVLSGNPAGCICSWKSSRLIRETQGHATGPMSQVWREGIVEDNQPITRTLLLFPDLSLLSLSLHLFTFLPTALSWYLILQRPDGSKMYGGVRCLVLESDRILLSGGADGYVIKWDVSSGDLGPALQV